MSSASIQPDNPQGFRDTWKALLVVIVIYLVGIIAFLFVTSGCSPKAIEHLHEQKRDTVYVAKHDSLYFYDRDSIFVKEKGDTVYKYVEKWRWRDRWHTDTLYKERVDSVVVERTKEVQIEKPLSAWQSFKMRGFWWLLGAVVALLVWVFRKQLIKLLKI